MGDEHMTSIILVCWWREHSAQWFVEMNVYEYDLVMFVSKIN
jgi:hypothetical protein